MRVLRYREFEFTPLRQRVPLWRFGVVCFRKGNARAVEVAVKVLDHKAKINGYRSYGSEPEIAVLASIEPPKSRANVVAEGMQYIDLFRGAVQILVDLGVPLPQLDRPPVETTASPMQGRLYATTSAGNFAVTLPVAALVGDDLLSRVDVILGGYAGESNFRSPESLKREQILSRSSARRTCHLHAGDADRFASFPQRRSHPVPSGVQFVT
jgi:hypothetical protein